MTGRYIYTPHKGEGDLHLGGQFYKAGEVIAEKHIDAMGEGVLQSFVDDKRLTPEEPPAPVTPVTPPVPPAPVGKASAKSKG